MISNLKLARLRKISAHNAYLTSRPLDVKARELGYGFHTGYFREMIGDLIDRTAIIRALGTPTKLTGRASSYCVTDQSDIAELADAYLRELADAVPMMMAAE